MQDDDMYRRATDLSRKCLDRGIVTFTGFLTPAESYRLAHSSLAGLYLFGGSKGCERKAAFFLPNYLEPKYFEAGDYISAFECHTKFAEPSHRDYLGALLGLGLERRCIGDIFVLGEHALFFCIKSVSEFIAQNLDRIGKHGVILKNLSLSDVNLPEKQTELIRFTVAGVRLDSVISGLFNISRSQAAEKIHQGLITLNYEINFDQDTRISIGDIISLRGKGKAQIADFGLPTRKGRIPVSAEKYI